MTIMTVTIIIIITTKIMATIITTTTIIATTITVSVKSNRTASVEREGSFYFGEGREVEAKEEQTSGTAFP